MNTIPNNFSSLESWIKLFKIFILGLFAGAASWAICLLFGKFEPFDTDPGAKIGQLILSSLAIKIAWTYLFKDLLILILGIYMGQNIYAYIFGGDELRAWFTLALFTTSLLLVVPFSLGSMTILIKYFYQRRRKSHQNTLLKKS